MPITIFLADDHAVVRDGLKALLEEEADIRVVGTAADGREALRQIKKIHPEIVIMDIAMPELNGIDATAKIREDYTDIAVIILSMHASSEYIYRALKAGAQGYLLKQSAGNEVVQAVRSVHAGRRYLSRRIEEAVFDDYVQRHPMASKSPIEKLSAREREILQMVVEGKSSAEIAKLIFVSPKTVETYRRRLMAKLEIRDLPALVKFAIKHGLTTIDT